MRYLITVPRRLALTAYWLVAGPSGCFGYMFTRGCSPWEAAGMLANTIIDLWRSP